MILDAQPGITVVGEAADGRQAIVMARSLRPDVCLLDIRMPDVDGIEATRQLAGPDVAEPWPSSSSPRSTMTTTSTAR